jgi:hypothetical protein
MGAARFTSLRSAVPRERAVSFRESPSGSTKSLLDSSRSGFDWTKSNSDFDERSAKEDNRRSPKCKLRLVLLERLLANEETCVVFEE